VYVVAFNSVGRVDTSTGSEVAKTPPVGTASVPKVPVVAYSKAYAFPVGDIENFDSLNLHELKSPEDAALKTSPACVIAPAYSDTALAAVAS